MNGYGIFVAVNATNGKGRSTADIVRARALFVDLDGSPIGPVYDAPLQPHIIIESSPERYHAYWLIEDLPLEHFKSAQQFLAQQFNGDPSVCDLPRIMRLPGFIHRKQAPYRSRIIETTSTLPYSFETFQETLGWSSVGKVCDQESLISADSLVLTRLREQGRLKQEEDRDKGLWRIRCPWSHEHSDGNEDAHFYAKPSREYPLGGFKCFHAHCKHRDLRALRFFLGLSPLEGVEPLPLFREVPLTMWS